MSFSTYQQGHMGRRRQSSVVKRKVDSFRDFVQNSSGRVARASVVLVSVRFQQWVLLLLIPVLLALNNHVIKAAAYTFCMCSFFYLVCGGLLATGATATRTMWSTSSASLSSRTLFALTTSHPKPVLSVPPREKRHEAFSFSPFHEYEFSEEQKRKLDGLREAAAVERAKRNPPKPWSIADRDKPTFIVCFDGGGIKGGYELRLFERITTEFPGLMDNVDLFAGTSAGAIICGLLASGFTPANAMEGYRITAPMSCRTTMAQQLFSLGGLAAEKYDGTGKIEMLRRAFGNIKMRDLVHGIAIPSLRLNAAQSSRSAAGDFDDVSSTFGENVRDDQGLLKKYSPKVWTNVASSDFYGLSPRPSRANSARMSSGSADGTLSPSSISVPPALTLRLREAVIKADHFAANVDGGGDDSAHNNGLSSSSASSSSTVQQSPLPSSLFSRPNRSASTLFAESGDRNVRLLDVVAGSTAAPTFYPSHHGHVDGGLWLVLRRHSRAL